MAKNIQENVIYEAQLQADYSVPVNHPTRRVQKLQRHRTALVHVISQERGAEKLLQQSYGRGVRAGVAIGTFNLQLLDKECRCS